MFFNVRPNGGFNNSPNMRQVHHKLEWIVESMKKAIKESRTKKEKEYTLFAWLNEPRVTFLTQDEKRT